MCIIKLMMFLFVIVAFSGFILPAIAEATTTRPSVLRVGNDVVERFMFLDQDQSALTSTGLRIHEGRMAWTATSSAGVEYLFKVRNPETEVTYDLSSSDPHVSVNVSRSEKDSIETLAITMKCNVLSIDVTLYYECYFSSGFVRRWTAITNCSDERLILEEVSLETLLLAVDKNDLIAKYGLARTTHDQWPFWFDLHKRELSDSDNLLFDTGREGNATWLMLSRKSADEGFVLGWETYAPTQCHLDEQGKLTVTMRPEYHLEPGETFNVPKAFVGLYEGDEDDGCYATHRFVEEWLTRPIPDDRFPYLMFNSWGYGRAIDDSLAREAIGVCAKLGVELFVVDFGWEDPDWFPLESTFPYGLAPLADLCHANDMKFGCHLSFGNVSEKSLMFKEHPDWVYGEGCWAYGQGKYPVYALSIGVPETRQWITNKVIEVIDREKIDWFLTDTVLYGEVDPDKHNLVAEQKYLAAAGFEKALDEIYMRRPDVLIEHCDNGLTMPNYKMLAQHVTSITCDNANAIDTRISVYNLSYFMPPRYLDKYQQEWRSHYANRSCMFGGPWILMMPIHTLEPDSQDWKDLVDDIAIYKQYRSRIRDGKVLHLVAPGLPSDPTWDGWDAIGSYNPTEDAAIVFVFRTRGEKAERVIPMKSLHPDHRYRVSFVDNGKSYEDVGSIIMCEGIALALDAYHDDPRSYCSEVILIEPVFPLNLGE